MFTCFCWCPKKNIYLIVQPIRAFAHVLTSRPQLHVNPFILEHNHLTMPVLFQFSPPVSSRICGGGSAVSPWSGMSVTVHDRQWRTLHISTLLSLCYCEMGNYDCISFRLISGVTFNVWCHCNGSYGPQVTFWPQLQFPWISVQSITMFTWAQKHAQVRVVLYHLIQ